MIYPGFIMARLARWCAEHAARVGDQAEIMTIDNHQSNGSHGVHQARVILSGDPTTYRMLIAPADAPITINGQPIGEHFAKPLGDR